MVDPGEDEQAQNTAAAKSAAGAVEKSTAADFIETISLVMTRLIPMQNTGLKLKPSSLKLDAYRSSKSKACLFINKSSTCREVPIACLVLSRA